MAKPPRTTRPPAPAPAPASADVDTAPALDTAGAETICMLVGQEGPDLSRIRGQILVIGVDLNAEEAQRLVDADFAERG